MAVLKGALFWRLRPRVSHRTPRVLRQYAPGGKLRDRIDSKPLVYGEIRRRISTLAAKAAKALAVGTAPAKGGGGHGEKLST